MEGKTRFDKRSLLELKPAEKLYRVKDPRAHGLNIVVHPTGRKTWNVIKRPHGGKPITRVLGVFPDMTISQARDVAADELSAIAGGINKNRVAKRSEAENITLGEARIKYLESKNVFENESGETYFRKGLKPEFSEGSIKDYRVFIVKYVPDWKDTPIRLIDEEMILDRYQHLSRTISAARANSAMRCFRAIYNRAYFTTKDENRKPVLPENPVKILGQTGQWQEVKRRKTIIRRADLPDWFEALQSMPVLYASPSAKVYHAYASVMLYTGLRPSHLLPLSTNKKAHFKNDGSRGYYDKREKLFYFYTQKNEKEMEIPLSTQAIDIIRGLDLTKDWLFTTAVKKQLTSRISAQAFDWIAKQSGVSAVPSDLRRTFLTIAESMDLSPYAYKTLVGHNVTDGKQDVTGGYISSENDRLRRATQLISDQIELFSSSPQNKPST